MKKYKSFERILLKNFVYQDFPGVLRACREQTAKSTTHVVRRAFYKNPDAVNGGNVGVFAELFWPRHDLLRRLGDSTLLLR